MLTMLFVVWAVSLTIVLVGRRPSRLVFRRNLIIKMLLEDQGSCEVQVSCLAVHVLTLRTASAKLKKRTHRQLPQIAWRGRRSV